MQAIELDATITKGEIHIRLPADINADTARVIVLFEPKPAAASDTNLELLQYLDGMVAQRDWPIRSKEEIDRTLDEERASWD